MRWYNGPSSLNIAMRLLLLFFCYHDCSVSWYCATVVVVEVVVEADTRVYLVVLPEICAMVSELGYCRACEPVRLIPSCDRDNL